ncbi:hypothetical protein [Acinetobacter nosocomialis]|uniref:hypothetical protein n=1 Tax=Acinetobacter nosocomialis TaxID=106654 RepID=UPI0033B1B42B
MSSKKIKVEEPLDVELSKSGTNAYYCDFCPHTGNRPNYAACLNRIERVQKGDDKEMEVVCTVAIHRHHCEALEMREREIEAGKALYYINRAEIQKKVGINLANKDNSISSKFTYKSALTNEKSEKVEEETPLKSKGDLTLIDAINSNLKKKSSVTKNDDVESQTVNKVSANLYLKDKKSEALSNIESGMSLIEIANRIKAKT